MKSQSDGEKLSIAIKAIHDEAYAQGLADRMQQNCGRCKYYETPDNDTPYCPVMHCFVWPEMTCPAWEPKPETNDTNGSN